MNYWNDLLDKFRSRSSIRVALIADELTREALRHECTVLDLTPANFPKMFRNGKPDFLFVESAWNGYRSAWKFQIAAYPDRPERSNKRLAEVVKLATSLGIPTVFWNKEDGVHFDRFIDSAKLFDHIFTVDENCIANYRAHVGKHVTVQVLPFAVQPAIHYFSGFRFKHCRAVFAGSYSRHLHDGRRHWQDAVFGAALSSGLGLTVIDRNSSRTSKVYRYPECIEEVKGAVSYPRTANIFRDYLVSINVNTVVNSRSMYSRRLVEILACGGIAVTNPTLAVERYFKDYCHSVQTAEEAFELFQRLRRGPSADDLERAAAGAHYVAEHHTWRHRLEKIGQTLGKEFFR